MHLQREVEPKEKEEEEGEEELIVENPVYARPPSLVFRRETLIEETVVAENISRRVVIVSGVTENGDYVAFPQTTYVLNVCPREKEDERNKESNSNEKKNYSASAA